MNESLLKDYLLLGELSLDGGVKPVRGCLPVAVAAKQAGFRGIIVPRENAPEGAVVEGIEVIGVTELAEVVEFLNGERPIVPVEADVEELFRQNSEYRRGLLRGQGAGARQARPGGGGGRRRTTS